MEPLMDEPTPDVIQPKKILRAHKDFGVHIPGDTTWMMRSHTPQDERKILDVFENNGYLIVRGGEFNARNPLEMGFSSIDITDSELIDKLGLEAPLKTPVDKVLESDKPLVAKANFSDRGENIYLLETLEQKQKFITWLVGWKRGIINEDDKYKAIDEIKDLLNKAKDGNISSAELSVPGIINNWTFEEFIDTPSSSNTSYRILVDGHGKIHYSQLNKSGDHRADQKLRDDTKHVPIYEELKLSDDFLTLLVHPRSPLYLGAKDIVSNISMGGGRILLDGKPVESDDTRLILEDHGLNPDKPIIPEHLLEMTKKIGIMMRGTHPYVGVDFIQDREGHYYFLEANAGPILNLEALGMSKESGQQDGELEMMRRVSLSNPKT